MATEKVIKVDKRDCPNCNDHYSPSFRPEDVVRMEFKYDIVESSCGCLGAQLYQCPKCKNIEVI